MNMCQMILDTRPRNRVSDELNRLNTISMLNTKLDKAKTKEERIEAVTSIRQSVSLDPISEILLRLGVQGCLI